MNAIILTAEQAESVRGNYGRAILEPAYRADLDCYVLGVQVLDMPAFAEAHDVLRELPVQEIPPAPEPDIE